MDGKMSRRFKMREAESPSLLFIRAFVEAQKASEEATKDGMNKAEKTRARIEEIIKNLNLKVRFNELGLPVPDLEE